MKTWDEVWAVAEEQHGAFTTQQALRAGGNESWLARRRAERRIDTFFRGAYGVLELVDEWTVVAAAQLVAPRAVAGYTTAAKLHGFDGIDVVTPDLLVPPGTRLRGLAVHRTRDLVVPELRVLDGIRCTDEIRTLVDVAAVLEPPNLERALESYRRRPHADLVALRDRAEALSRPGRAGPRQLLCALDRLPATATDSDLETVYWQCLREHGVPMPQRQVPVGPFRLDLAWADVKLYAELDGYATHSDRAAFGRDRQRQNWLVGQDWTPLRFTDSDVRSHGRRTAWITDREVRRRRAGLVALADAGRQQLQRDRLSA